MADEAEGLFRGLRRDDWRCNLPQSNVLTLHQHSINTPRAGYVADPSPYAERLPHARISGVFSSADAVR